MKVSVQEPMCRIPVSHSLVPERRAFTGSLHAPVCGRTANHEGLAGAFGIPDFKSPPAMGLLQEQQGVKEMEKQTKTMLRWKTDLIVLFVLISLAFWINQGMEIKGLYMDDLYLWSCYGEQSFFQFVFPMGSTRFRFLYYLFAWLELALIGNRVWLIVPVNIVLNVGIAFTLYQMAHRFSHSASVGVLAGIAFLFSRMAYYQIGQLYGLMETMATWMALGILYQLCEYLNGEGRAKDRCFVAACLLYVGICFVHERYMVLIPLFFLVLLFHRSREIKMWLWPAVSFALVQAVRLITIGGLMPAGTGGTNVADTWSVGSAIRFAASQVAYLFGINAGPEHLNGQNFRQSPIWILVLVGIADILLLALVAAFVVSLVRHRITRPRIFQTCVLFVGFIGGCIACSSVTIRVEMRWVYVSYGAALLFLSWIYGVMTELLLKKGMLLHAVPYLAVIAAYVMVMAPVELYYRQMYPNLYYWPNQQRYNSLAEETYGTYGQSIFGKTIYIVGNQYEMSDFTADTFFKVFDKERKAENTQVVHIEDIWEAGVVTEDMLILQEEPEFDRFRDITETVRNIRCRSVYGYYRDGWMDERAEIRLMAGETGQIELDFLYPRELKPDQWLTVYVNGEPVQYLELDENQKAVQVQVLPFERVKLEIETNFYVEDAQEQRGEDRLAVLLALKAD